jgi:uncharacterized protein (DUF362 family)
MTPVPEQVAVVKAERAAYPDAPFDPPCAYAEFAASPSPRFNPANAVYGAVRAALQRLGMDREHIDTAEWSPLRDLVLPGQHVVIKPNLVKGDHPLGHVGIESMVTHASVIRPLIDYVMLATRGDVRLTICDAPVQSAVWTDVIEHSGVRALVEYYASRGFEIELLDLRREVSVLNEEQIVCRRSVRERDPRGYLRVDLGEHSALAPVVGGAPLEITDYPTRSVAHHHNHKRNEYLVAGSILSADFFICVPKLKTHKKTGISVAMKNLIGIIGDKSWIAHHRRGAPSSGGDEFPHARLWPLLQSRTWDWLKAHPSALPVATSLKRICRHTIWKGKTLEEVRMSPPTRSPIFEGSWYGNDTLWRCVLDLNNIVFFADKQGRMHNTPQRNYLCVVDGVIGGEGEGPMQQLPKESGLILAGVHPVSLDYAAARLMGLEPTKIATIRGAFREEMFPFVRFTPEQVEQALAPLLPLGMPFLPPMHWRGHIEPESSSL